MHKLISSYFSKEYIKKNVNNNNDRQKKSIGVSAYNSKTVDRRDIKENGSIIKMNSMTNINKSKDDINGVNKEKNHLIKSFSILIIIIRRPTQ